MNPKEYIFGSIYTFLENMHFSPFINVLKTYNVFKTSSFYTPSVFYRFLTCLGLFFWGFSTQAQKIVEGQVYDAESNKPLAGVLIFAKNTVKTTKTDLTGFYRIIIPEKANVMVFSLSGYAKQEVNITGANRVDIGMRNFFSKEAENIVVIGSRDITRKKSDSYSAVDVIPVKQIVNNSGFIELPQILHHFTASFNANKQSGGDLADHVDPVSLRGLGPDQVLFLVNGKRYLRSAIINVFGSLGRGNVNSDINSIPASAVERVEILRDGAAAQYGSDAIAGVVNIVLKSEFTGTSGTINYGSHYTGWGKSLDYNDTKIIPKTVDGAALNANITHTFKLKEGNLTVIGDYFSREPTLRPNNDVVFPDANHRQEFGVAKQSAKNFYFNGRYPLKKAEIYAFGGIHDRYTESAIWTIPAEDSSRNVYEIYNNGYNPHLKTHINNLFISIGTKSKIKKWDFDLSYTYGDNHVHLTTINTLNPSLLTKSPTSFNNGQYHFTQFLFNTDFSRKFPKVLKGLNLAFGAEHRFQNYRIIEGEDASWKTYISVIDKDTIKKTGTSQGFPGVSPNDALDEYRSHYGFYGDAELTISPKLMVATSLRYEIYSGFINALGSKMALRYKPTPQYSMRFSVQRGFRLASLAQKYYHSTINDVDGNGNNFEKVIANNTHEISQKLGVPRLGVEKSYNLSLGIAYNPTPKLSISTDAYYIRVKDRIILSGEFGQDDDKIGADLKNLNLKYTQFFINALKTKTFGMDISTNYKTNIFKGQLNINLAGNINHMITPTLNVDSTFKGKEEKLINQRELQFIRIAAPLSKIHSQINYQYNKLTCVLHFIYFSKVSTVNYDDSDINTYKPLLQTNLRLTYNLFKNTSLTLGANNIFDKYPTIQSPDSTETGGQWEAIQNGFGGMYIFSNLSWRF